VVITNSPKNVRPTEEATSLTGEMNVVVYVVFFSCSLVSRAIFMLCSIAQQKKNITLLFYIKSGAQPRGALGAFAPPETFKTLHSNFGICRNFQEGR